MSDSVEYLDSSLVEEGTEDCPVPSSVLVEETESLDFKDNEVELQRIIAEDAGTVNAACAQDEKPNKNFGLIALIIIVAVVIAICIIKFLEMKKKNGQENIQSKEERQDGLP